MTNPTPRYAAGDESQRLEIRRAMKLAVWSWPTFTLLDIYMVGILYPATPVWHFISLRLVEEVFLVIVYFFSFRPNVRLSSMIALNNTAFITASLFIALMAFDFGSLNSSYIHGISLVVLVRSVTIVESWQLVLRALIPIALSFPSVMALAGLVSPTVRASWLDRHVVFVFLSNYVFVFASVVIGAIASHLVWAANRQLYQARKLGRYRLEAPIGKGGMAEVWLARDETLRRKVALKLMRMETPAPEAIARFEREARTTSRLSDPHTIRIFDFGASSDGIYYIAMEYLDGTDLATLVRNHGPLPVARVVQFACQACQSLIEAHDAGIVHRDIKPQNMFVTRAVDGQEFLKVLDFGIARVVDVDLGDTHITRTGVIRGTPAYMAPEVCRGAPADVRSDIYSLGATLYLLLTGVAAFDGPTPGAIFAAQITEPPIPPSVRCNEPLPELIEQLVLCCLAKDPQDRFQNVRELLAALRKPLDIEPWSSTHAQRFWQVDYRAKLERWDAPTQ
ncbi:MAG TPA: serine/threonine-protein kinase [Polyangium sp.]|nr:serine/threonine-protein kinase [Polyangium sp.]